MSDNLPRHFGPYLLEKFIAEGGMARVYRARRLVDPTGPPVVVKLMRAEISEDAQGPAMFRDEARLAHMLVHPNIVRVFDFGEHGGDLFMAMELIDGPNIGQLQRVHGQALPPRTALLVAIELCEALDYAHKVKDANGRPMHLVHRDVSPQNVLLTLAGELKLADFGIAKVAFGREALTKTNFIKGKIGYMAPEQLLGKSLDHRSDQFAAGIILWEMLCGTRLFKEKTEALNIQKVVYGRAERPSVINRNLPAGLDDVVLRALEKEADKRYADMHEFSRAIRAALTRFPASPDDGVEHIIARMTGRPPPPRANAPAGPGRPAAAAAAFVPPPQTGSDPGNRSRSAPWSKLGAPGTPSNVPLLAIGSTDFADAPTQHRDNVDPVGPPSVRTANLTPASGLRSADSGAFNTLPLSAKDRSGSAPRTGETSVATSIAPRIAQTRAIPVWVIAAAFGVAVAAFAGGVSIGMNHQPDLCGTLSSEPRKIDGAYDKAVEAQRLLEGGNTVDAVTRAQLSLATSATGRAHFVLARAALSEFRNKDAFFHMMCVARLDPEGDEVRWALERIKRRD